MKVIFKNFNIKAVLEKIRSYDVPAKTVEFLKNNKVIVKIVCLSLVGLLSVGINIAATGLTFGFNVKYSGKNIATVRNETVVKEAQDIAKTSVSTRAAKNAIKNPELSFTLTIQDKLASADKVADAIIHNTGDIIDASVLVVNGQKIVFADTKELNTAVEQRKNSFALPGAQNVTTFVDTVEIIDGYYLKSDIDCAETLNAAVANLAIKNVATITADVTTPYTTKQIYTDTQERGYYKVNVAGKNGLNRKTEVIETINGVQTQRIVLADEVLAAPVTRVVTVGTAPAFVSATEHANITSAGFICPISKSKIKKITAYWGDGRNHQGIDLAADKGTPIFAVSAGTVESAGWHNQYGYNVIINHGNGIKTRYGHASALCVRAGQTVGQGDMIATVGSTGYSTGPHLHFEVIINGKRVNPVAYIGLN